MLLHNRIDESFAEIKIWLVYNISLLGTIWYSTKLHYILFYKRAWSRPRTHEFILCRERYWKPVLYSCCRSWAVWVFWGKVWSLPFILLIIKLGCFVSHSQFIYPFLFFDFIIYALSISDSLDLAWSKNNFAE